MRAVVPVVLVVVVGLGALGCSSKKESPSAAPPRPSAVASVVGLGGMAGSALGIFFPIMAGRLLDTFTAKNNVSGGYALLFSICAGAYILAFIVQHLLAPKFEQVELKRL